MKKNTIPPLPINLPARYTFLNKTFEGGQGKAFLCLDEYLDRQVIVKTLHTSRSDALIDELRALSLIQSKHVVRIYDLIPDESSGVSALILEFIPGSDLTTTQLKTTKKAMLAFYQICAGIADIHSAGYIHRDVKPKNLKFDADGIIKLFDFGIASNTFEAETQAKRGSLFYRAPEYYTTNEAYLTQAVDVYAFGVTAWWLLAQSLPNQLRSRPPGRPDSFATLPVHFPDSILSLLDRTFEPEPRDRPSSAELRDAFLLYLLEGKHRARFVSGGLTRVIEEVGQTASLNASGKGTLKVKYDGINFIAESVSGDVYRNGTPITAGQIFIGSCVISLGSPRLGSNRDHISFDISTPQIVL